jgi:vWA found in TerF C terminus
MRKHDSVRQTAPLIFDPHGIAVDLGKVESKGGITLSKKTEKAGDALARIGLAGLRCEVLMVLDHSASMSPFYRDGTVQQIVERALGFGLAMDADGKVPVIPFDTKVHKPTVVDIDNFRGIVDRIWMPDKMGTTNLADALVAARKHVEKAKLPTKLAVVTDGDPNNPEAATNEICELAGYPCFIKILAVRPVAYLRTLDSGLDGRRLLDNVNSKYIGDPSTMDDREFADAMTEELDEWIQRALSAGVLIEQ